MMLVLCFALVLTAPAPSFDRDVGIGNTLQLQSQLGLKQYEDSEDHLKLEFELLRQLTPTQTADLIPMFKEQDEMFDEAYNQTHHPAPLMSPNNCSSAPDCSSINRHHCFWKENTCGPCLHGFHGTSGDSNDPCTVTDCSEAPDCALLNREPCGTREPNTCGPCLDDFHLVNSTWDPRVPDTEHGNDQCLAVEMRPIVFIHGLGDTFRGWTLPAQIARRTFHILKAFSAEPGGAVFSMTKPFSTMVEDFANEVKQIPSLSKGFNLLGVSQGGLIARAYVEKFNDPPVYNLISLHGPQSGIAQCPGLGIDMLPCQYAVHWGLVTPHDYWHGPDAQGILSKQSYLSWGNYLMDINNEGENMNITYKEHMTSLNRYVLVKAERDQVVRPAESEWHGYLEWGGDMKQTVKMENTPEYQQDLIGLKTLDESKRLKRIRTSGGHLQFPPNFFEDSIYPFLHNGWYQDGTPFDLEGEFSETTRAKHA